MTTEQNTAPSGWDKVEGGARTDQDWSKAGKTTDAERSTSQQGQLKERIDQKIKQVAERLRGEKQPSQMQQKIRQLAEHFNGGRGRESRDEGRGR